MEQHPPPQNYPILSQWQSIHDGSVVQIRGYEKNTAGGWSLVIRGDEGELTISQELFSRLYYRQQLFEVELHSMFDGWHAIAACSVVDQADRRIVVVDAATFEKAVKQDRVDALFMDTPVAARFEGTERGWEWAEAFAKAIATKGY